MPKRDRLDFSGLDVREKSQFEYRGLRYFAHRGELRRKVLDYAFERGLMHPEDFGTMSHWYSRTPWAFLEKMKPPFIPQQAGSYGHPTDRVWDVRDRRWLDAYWKITEASLANYGKPDILHTIGLGERRCSTNRAENTKMKVDVLNLNLAEARRRYPNSKYVVAGWDFFQEWRPEEIKDLFSKLDWTNLILWDYEADATRDYRADMMGLVNNFTKWDVVGKHPYTFGIFLCLEQGIDCRADYKVIEERQKAILGDPFCKGYIFWPESSHTDTFLLHYFTRNSWRAGERGVSDLLAEFCRDRYGREADRFRRAWETLIPAAAPIGWGGNYGSRCVQVPAPNEKVVERTASYADLAKRFATFFGELAAIDRPDEAAVSSDQWAACPLRRDTIDLARTAGDRLAVAARADLFNTWRAWRDGAASGESVKAAARRYAALGAAMADLLEQHTDFSIYDSFRRLDAVEKIRNPDFDKVLFDNASCGYCRSHQAELARHWYLPVMRLLADTLTAKVEANDRTDYSAPALRTQVEALLRTLQKRSLVELRPTASRTEAKLKAALKALAEVQNIQ